MIHAFDTTIARQFGVHEAIFLSNLSYWIAKNKSEKKHLHDGRYWSYNSVSAFVELFEYLTTKQVRTAIQNCIKHGLIVKSNYNEKKYDKTLWYAFSDVGLELFPTLKHVEPAPSLICPKRQIHLPKTANLYQIENTDINTISVPAETPTTATEEKPKTEKVTPEQIRDAYHEALPDSPKTRVIDDKLANQLKAMVNKWPKYSSSGKSFTLEGFKSYLLMVKKHQPRFLEPYTTEQGGTRRNNLRTLTRDQNICRLLNNEFSF